jgi:hypothetical protein
LPCDRVARSVYCSCKLPNLGILPALKPKGRCGYLSKLFEEFYEQGLHLVTKIRKNMTNILMDLDDKVRLKKRGLIESVNDILMSVLDIDHSRHRSPANALVHTMAGLVAYHFYDGKPSVFIKPVKF